MKIDYITPQIEVIELDLEDVILQGSGKGSGTEDFKTAGGFGDF